jgi:D-glycero-beta-D-manno-heptose-7-phosphate kinase
MHDGNYTGRGLSTRDHFDGAPRRGDSVKRLADIVGSFSHKRVLVVGDAIADQFLYGEISRVSREAPVFILRHEHTETTPGGAANCAANLASLGADVTLVAIVGDDPPGKALVEKLRASGVNCEKLITSPGRRTTTKVRVLAGQTHSTRQQVIRIDYDSEPIGENEREKLAPRLREGLAAAEAVIVSDYNCGVVDVPLAAQALSEAARSAIPILVDSRFRLSDFPRFTSATPNEDEVEKLHGKPLKDDAELEVVGAGLRERLEFRALLVTRGSRGMVLLEKDAAPLHLDAVGPHEPVDVTGAGDTVIATYTLAVAAGASFADAARLANFAGGIVVMKRGTATVSAEELVNSIVQFSQT